MTDFNLKSLIEEWQRQCGVLRKSNKYGTDYYAIPFNDRFQAMLILVKTIKNAGKEREYFTNTVREQIVKECIPINPRSGTEKGWKEGTLRHLNMAIMDVYVNDREGSEVSNAISKASEEVKADLDGKPKAESVPVASTEPKKSIAFKEFDPSVCGNQPEVIREIDPEIAELLGIKKDE